ncbi:response regulator [Selenomonas sp. WCA-380-WT-3B 3/]|uniref:Response regulator n=1 Tax=Selenomonas montiformis TaxID=2652285 RepID=A0A6I2UXA0_9FIRM|nr:response regulator [Selenomonas montiformis]MSV24750.1 response regulator [Selenomonas montiformis]
MNILLIDDDEAVRMMLQDIIEDYQLGRIAASLPSAIGMDNHMLARLSADILIIDMLMPDLDGIRAVDTIRKGFAGKVIMLSQVESKDLVGKAYEHGIDYYITKPLNRNEIVRVLRNVSEHLRLESFAHKLKHSLDSLAPQDAAPKAPAPCARQRAQTILQEIGIGTAPGAQDLLDIIDWLEAHSGSIPSLKALFTAVAASRPATSDAGREAKAMEQRLRRALCQGHISLAAMGAVDCTNPRFEDYAPRFFDYTGIRSTMRQIEQEEKPDPARIHINLRKFISALYDQAHS